MAGAQIAEEAKTVSIPKHVVHPARWLNKSRDDLYRARQAAAMVGTPGATVACLTLAVAARILDAQTSVVSRRMIERRRHRPMKIAYAFLILVLAWPVYALAQAASLPADLSTQEALGQVLQTVGGLKGATVLGITAVILQIAFFAFRTPLASFAGKWRLLIVAALSLVSGTFALVANGVPWLQALGDANTLAALQVLGHQTIKQFTKDS